ncbi:hypothetical protein [Listeria sp. ILCC792]|uniref:hypothetical protein n=1 Tax=Listeria sp. ILCC792 TaxID=1918331 RepID=UPI000B58B961|nr:hypothetical protein [Listeria sp. ILCC792]
MKKKRFSFFVSFSTFITWFLDLRKPVGLTGIIWDDIKSTQLPREGTTIPKSFEINANGQKLTKQQWLRSFQCAVEQAAPIEIKKSMLC